MSKKPKRFRMTITAEFDFCGEADEEFGVVMPLDFGDLQRISTSCQQALYFTTGVQREGLHLVTSSAVPV